MSRDFTFEAVSRQLRAMNCPLYDITCKNSVSGAAMVYKDKSMQEVFSMVPFLKRMNSKQEAEHIYVCPARSTARALILVDDIKPYMIQKLRSKGLEPCCVVETSPHNMQAWVDFGPDDMPAGERRVLAKFLQEFVGGDAGCVAANHNGRLSGFVNPKPKYKGLGRNGGYPFVTCAGDSRPRICSKAQSARRWAHKEAKRLASMPSSSARPASAGSGTGRAASGIVHPAAYAETVLLRAVQDISTRAEGRNHGLYVDSMKVGTVMHMFCCRTQQGLMDELIAAGVRSGLTASECRATVHSAFGIAKPLDKAKS